MKMNFRYEGERNSQYKQKISECVEYILDKKYGDTLSHEELSHILGYNINDEMAEKQYKSSMARVKNILLQFGYVLKSISGIGFYILKPTQISQHCYRTYVKSASRMYEKSEYILEHTDKSSMSDIRKEEIENMMKMNNKLITNMWDTIKESAYYSRKTVYDNLED